MSRLIAGSPFALSSRAEARVESLNNVVHPARSLTTWRVNELAGSRGETALPSEILPDEPNGSPFTLRLPCLGARVRVRQGGERSYAMALSGTGAEGWRRARTTGT